MNHALHADVAILGGGLAGLSLAIQLRQRDPALAVTVLERREGAAPDAAFKVGESTVEIGAHYFAETLGLREHLEREQIRKFGFRFFFSEGSHDPARCTELGVSELLPTPSWQLDRGRFENFLADHARGMSFLLAHRILPPGAALFAGFALAVPSLHAVTWALGGNLLYPFTILLGNLQLLLTHEIFFRRPDRPGLVLVAGVFAGIGWWTNPLTVVYCVPFALLALRTGLVWRATVWLFPLGLLLGGLPDWIFEVVHYPSARLLVGQAGSVPVEPGRRIRCRPAPESSCTPSPAIGYAPVSRC